MQIWKWRPNEYGRQMYTACKMAIISFSYVD